MESTSELSFITRFLIRRRRSTAGRPTPNVSYSGPILDYIFDNGMYAPLGQCQNDNRWHSQSAPEVHRLDSSDTCHVERHHRTVGDYDAVLWIPSDHPFDRARHPAEGLSGRLGAKHKLIRLAEKSLDRILKLTFLRKEAYVVTMMLLDPIRDLNWNPERVGNNFGGFDRLWFFATPDQTGIKALKLCGEQFTPCTSGPAESPGGRRFVVLHMGL